MIISIFGDSIVWGAHDLKLGGWVNRLRLYFNNKGDYETDVYNNGISGDYIKDVLKRFDTEAQARNPDKWKIRVTSMTVPNGRVSLKSTERAATTSGLE